jgi:D-alanyl-D-alanine dipeptidase
VKKDYLFFKLLKKIGKFEWTEEAKDAFEKLKAYLTSSPILTPPKKHEAMLLYIAATSLVVSAAIVVEREEEGHVYKVQRPSTTSMRYYQIPKSDSHIYKNYSTPS